MKEYVLGFVFDKQRPDLVALLRKTRPPWQVGKLNGIGGKIEPGEFPLEAMVREAKEEAGLTNALWQGLGLFHGPGWEMWVYRGSASVRTLRQMEDEALVICDYAEAAVSGEVVSNLAWVLPYARFFNREYSEGWLNVEYK